ncbi:MAG: RagB/SusD family nutrient uptake outer membrane protein [Leeuwenhoekiella sp.]
MMKKFKLHSILILSVSLFGCSDFLEVEPDQQISITEQLSTKAGVLEALNGIYRDVEAQLSGRTRLYADLQGGNLTFSPSVTTQLIGVPGAIENSYDFSDLEEQSDYAGMYADYYDIINQINVILAEINAFDFFSSAESDQLEAELLSIRALAHYELSIHYAQNYGFTEDAGHLGIVYATQPLDIGEDFPSRLSLRESYALLKMDLETALGLFTSQQALPGPDYSLFNTITTQALYARIALQMNDWPQALAMANAVIQSSGISLTTTENLVEQWEKDEEPIDEVILEFSAPRSSEGDVSSSIAAFFNYNAPDNYDEYVASGDLLKLYSDQDVRGELFIETALPTKRNDVTAEETYYFTKKFQGNAGTLYIRLSEIYLIKAEAHARIGETNQALAALNTIRERAGLSPLNSTVMLLEEIFIERRRELVFEGHLYFDIARFQRDVTRDEGCLATTCDLDYPSNFFVLPIPTSSTELNQNIVQNEGY